MKWVFLFLILLAAPALADEVPLLFTRTHLTITRQAPPSLAPMPWQGKDAAPAAGNPQIGFDVTVRDAMTIYNQNGWFDLNTPSEHEGVLMAFPAPGISPVIRTPQYAPLDILFIDKEGTITEIAPSITLSALEDDLTPEKPVLAFLFLKGGLCEKLAIHPGDSVEYKIFKKPPAVLSAPPPAAPPAQAPAPAN